MAGITRVLTFSEGVSTGGPITTFLQTTQFATYANDAAFVTGKGSAAADGPASSCSAGAASVSFASERAARISNCLNIADVSDGLITDFI